MSSIYKPYFVLNRLLVGKFFRCQNFANYFQTKIQDSWGVIFGRGTEKILNYESFQMLCGWNIQHFLAKKTG